MIRIPVATATEVLGTMKCVEVARSYRDGAPQEREGIPVWEVTVLHKPPARSDGRKDKAAVEFVKVASATEPKVEGSYVTFTELTAIHWTMANGRNGIALSASGVQAVRGES